MIKIIVNLTATSVWKNKKISMRMTKNIVEECLKATKTTASMVFLNINYINTDTMIKYNSKYRNISADTNVLSFSNCSKTSVFYGKKHNVLQLGDLLLCFEKINNEAIEYNKTFENRLMHLIVHGILHLLGYDHMKYIERIEMENLEEKILTKFGINHIYD